MPVELWLARVHKSQSTTPSNPTSFPKLTQLLNRLYFLIALWQTSQKYSTYRKPLGLINICVLQEGSAVSFSHGSQNRWKRTRGDNSRKWTVSVVKTRRFGEFEEKSAWQVRVCYVYVTICVFRTDELLLELDDDELDSAFPTSVNGPISVNSQHSVNSIGSSPKSEDPNGEENEPVAPLKRRPIIGLYGLNKSPAMYGATKSFENGTIPSVNGHVNGTVLVNGENVQNGSTNCNGKLNINGDHAVVVPSASAPPTQTAHRPVSPSTSVIILPSATRNHHNWKTASLRNTTAVVENGNAGQTVTCSSPAFRQQTTVDDSHLSTTRSFSLKLEVPKNEMNGSWSNATSPQPTYNSSTNCLFSASGSVESTGVSFWLVLN